MRTNNNSPKTTEVYMKRVNVGAYCIRPIFTAIIAIAMAIAFTACTEEVESFLDGGSSSSAGTNATVSSSSGGGSSSSAGTNATVSSSSGGGSSSSSTASPSSTICEDISSIEYDCGSFACNGSCHEEANSCKSSLGCISIEKALGDCEKIYMACMHEFSNEEFCGNENTICISEADSIACQGADAISYAACGDAEDTCIDACYAGTKQCILDTGICGSLSFEECVEYERDTCR